MDKSSSQLFYHIVFTIVNENQEKPGSGGTNVTDVDGSDVQRLTRGGDWLDWTAFSYSVEAAGKLKSTWGKIKRELFSHQDQ